MSQILNENRIRIANAPANGYSMGGGGGSDIATKSWVLSQGFLTEDSEEFQALQQFVNNFNMQVRNGTLYITF